MDVKFGYKKIRLDHPDIGVGGAFTYKGCLYVRTDRAGGEMNSAPTWTFFVVRLFDGHVDEFPQSTLVQIPKHARVRWW